MPYSNLLTVYGYLFTGITLGWLLGRCLPRQAPEWLGQFLFWVGVPISVVGFLRGGQWSGAVWLAPAIAWAAIAGGLALAGGAIALVARLRIKPGSPGGMGALAQKRTQGSFLLAAMVGNTGYIGFPVALALVGPQYFVWSLFYDMLGSLLGSYGLGVVLASQFGTVRSQRWRPSRAILINPTLWSFGLGLLGREVPLPRGLDAGLKGLAWTMMALSLVLVGMRLGQLTSLKGVPVAIAALIIKMLIVPLILGTLLWMNGVTGPVHRAILLQISMPPAFATLVISEAYELDPELSVTALVMGCGGLLLVLPLWLTLFPV
jgi:malate permease and related proteins